MRLYFEFFKSPVFLQKFCIFPIFCMIEWFLMVSILWFKLISLVPLLYFSMIVSKIWCNLFSVYYIGNLALVGKGTVRFIYTITIHFSCFLFHDYFFIMYVDNWFDVCHAAITYFHIIFVESFTIFMFVWKTFWKKFLKLKEGNIYQCLRVFLLWFWAGFFYLFIYFYYLVVCIEVCGHT